MVMDTKTYTGDTTLHEVTQDLSISSFENYPLHLASVVIRKCDSVGNVTIESLWLDSDALALYKKNNSCDRFNLG